ncbi:MAG: adenylyl-sulfate kinase [Lachnospiraceae bacterium]|nr:adenylyl-sulfate kinase [Lachnospiraceae bacterium]
MLLDGDNVRLGLNSDLEFSEADRAENIRRVAEVSKLMNDAGIIVITTFISPLRTDRERAREVIGDGFLEIYICTPLSVCEERDVKGLYKRARSGEIEFFTGISSPYDEPRDPDLSIDTSKLGMEEIVDLIIDKEKEKGFL